MIPPKSYPHDPTRYAEDIKRVEEYLGRNAAKLIDPARIEWMRAVMRGEESP